MKKLFLVLLLLLSQAVIADASYKGWATWWPTPEEAGKTFYDRDRENNPDDCLWTAMRINYSDNPPTVRYESYINCTSTLKQWAQFLYVDWCPDGQLSNRYTGICEPIVPEVEPLVNTDAKTFGAPQCDSINSSVGGN